jgi:hypothetical protein
MSRRAMGVGAKKSDRRWIYIHRRFVKVGEPTELSHRMVLFA